MARELGTLMLVECLHHLRGRLGRLLDAGILEYPVAYATTPRREGAVFKPDQFSRHGETFCHSAEVDCKMTSSPLVVAARAERKAAREAGARPAFDDTEFERASANFSSAEWVASELGNVCQPARSTKKIELALRNENKEPVTVHTCRVSQGLRR